MVNPPKYVLYKPHPLQARRIFGIVTDYDYSTDMCRITIRLNQRVGFRGHRYVIVFYPCDGLEETTEEEYLTDLVMRS